MTSGSSGVNTTSVAQNNLPISSGMRDNLQNLRAFLGPTVGNLAPSAYDKVAYTNYDLPEAYKGKNFYVRDTIDGYILEDNEWYTTLCLPWVFSDNLHIVYNEWHFNTTYAGRVPHEGISRLVTSSKKEFKDHVVRKGLAVITEADFYNTPEGQEHWLRNIRGIAQAVQETQNYDTVHALLACKNYQKMWNEKFGTMDTSFRGIIQDEIRNYNAWCHDEHEFDIIIAEHTRNMNKRQVRPNLLILPPKARIYLTMVQPKQTVYWGMESGKPILKRGPDSLTTIPGGINVYETRDFQVDESGKFAQLLTRPVQIGERYPMMFTEHRHTRLRKYDSRWRDTYIYNEELDKMVKITFKQAIAHCHLFNENGDDFSDEVKNELEEVSNRNADDNGPLPTRPFFLITKNTDGEYILATHFGHLAMHVATKEDFLQTASSAVQDAEETPGVANAITDAVTLLGEIDNQTYNEEYFQALAAANTPDGGLEGNTASAPPQVARAWGSSAIPQWRPNAFGSMELPATKPAGVYFPSGFANAAGLETLAQEAYKNDSPWKTVGERALRIVSSLKILMNKLKKAFPTSEALKPENTSPWFHAPSSFTAFFEHVVQPSRPPIFLQSFAVAGSLGQGPGASSKVAVRPLYSFGLSDTATPAEMKEFMRSIFKKELPSGVVVTVDASNYIMDASGKQVVIDAEFLKTTGSIPPQLVAYALMGQYSQASLQNIVSLFDTMISKGERADEARQHKNGLFEWIVSFAQTNNHEKGLQRTRAVVRGLGQLATVDDVFDAVKDLTGNSKSKTKMRERINALTVPFKDVNDPSLDFMKLTSGESSVIDFLKGIKTSGEQGLISAEMQESKELLQAILDDVPVLAGLRSDSGITDDKPFIVATKKGWFEDVDNNQASDAYRDRLNTIAVLVTRLEALHPSRSSVGSSMPKFGKIGAKLDHNKPGRFYRTPLTMSPNLEASLRGLATPIVLPGAGTNATSPASNFGNPLNNPMYSARGVFGTPFAARMNIGDPCDDMDVDKPRKKKRSGGDIYDSDMDGEDWEAVKAEELASIPSFRGRITGILSHRFREAESIADSLLRPAYIVAILTPITHKAINDMIDADTHVPIGVILWRPSIEHDMSSAILMLGGSNTGGNVYNNSNFATGSDIVTKMLYGHFTFNSKAMVWNEKNVEIMENLKAEGYRGGNNTLFVEDPKELDSMERGRASIVATALPITEQNHPWAMSISGHLPISNVNPGIDGMQFQHYSSAPFYDRIYGFSKKMGQRNFASDLFNDVEDRINVVCMQGLQMNFNARRENFSTHVPCQGHRKANGSGYGVAAVWNGQAKYLKAQEPNTWNLE